MPWAHDLENYGRDLSGGRPTMRDEWDQYLQGDYAPAPAIDPGLAWRLQRDEDIKKRLDPWSGMSTTQLLMDPTSPAYRNTARPQMTIDDPWAGTAPAPLPNLTMEPAKMEVTPEATRAMAHEADLKHRPATDYSGKWDNDERIAQLKTLADQIGALDKRIALNAKDTDAATRLTVLRKQYDALTTDGAAKTPYVPGSGLRGAGRPDRSLSIKTMGLSDLNGLLAEKDTLSPAERAAARARWIELNP